MTIHANQLLDICESIRTSELVGDVTHIANPADLDDSKSMDLVLSTASDVAKVKHVMKDFGNEVKYDTEKGIVSIYRDPTNGDTVSNAEMIAKIKASAAIDFKITQPNLLGYESEAGAER